MKQDNVKRDNEQAVIENKTAEKGETGLNLKEQVRCYLKHWWWFAISVVVIVGAAFFYLKVTPTTSTTYSVVMFNQDEDDTPASSGLLGSLMSSFSMGGTGVNLDDEIFRIQSHEAIKRVVKELGLNKDYSAKTAFYKRPVIYFQNSPIDIELTSGNLDTISQGTEFELDLKDHGKKFHLKVKQGTFKTVFNDDIPGLPYTVKTPLGNFTLSTTSFYKPETNMAFKAYLCGLDDAAAVEFKNIDVYLKIKKSNAVEVKVDDTNSQRARAVANVLIELYNQNSMSVRSAQSRATLDFLNDRLLRLYSELEKSGSGIAHYKETNQLTDPSAEASYIMKMKETAGKALVEQETQLEVLKMVRDFLKSGENKYSLVPITSVMGADTEGINKSITSYNELVLELLHLQSSAKGNNSTIKLLENQIEAMRGNLLSSLDRSISAAQIAISRTNKESSTVDNRISNIPRMEQELTNLMRDNEVKNRIYAYLLQKREEAEMKVARIMPTGVVIDQAWTDNESIRPKKGMILMSCGLLALILPAIILFGCYRRQFETTSGSALRKEEDEIKSETD